MYNNGKTFPKALIELLYLVGKYCIVCDHSIFDMQEDVRELMTDNNRVINRTFYAIDLYGGEPVYLDEGDNPAIYEADYYHDPKTDDFSNWIHKLTPSISVLINHGLNRVKQGRNPF